MPARYRIFPEHNLYVVHFSGVVTSEEMLEVYRGVFDDASFRAGFHELSDMRASIDIYVDLDVLRRISELTESVLGSEGANMKTAQVSGSAAKESMSKLYKAVSEHGETEHVEFFSNVEDAVAWLGVDGLTEQDIDQM